MARIVAVSSFVAKGRVGLRAMVPALEMLGHDVMALPTVVLSSHAGYAHLAAQSVDPRIFRCMTEAMAANGWLESLDMIVTGYLPTAAHVSTVAEFIAAVRLKAPHVRFICDPVIGDEPKGLYVEEDTASAIRDQLLPSADLATPNAFELTWLTGKPIVNIRTAVEACRALGPHDVLATSVPGSPGELATLYCTPSEALFAAVPRRPHVPPGTGDLIAALFSGLIASGKGGEQALGLAAAWLENVLEATGHATELSLVPLYSGQTPVHPLTLQRPPI